MIARKTLATLGIATAIAGGAALVPSAVPQADAYTYNWGAIAYDYNGRVVVTRGDYSSSNAAVRAVKSRCGSHCGQFSFYNSCGAVAYKFTGSRTRVGTARGYATRAAASNAARSQAGYGSYVRGWSCTTRYN
ncbi:DUF4189 domain-containing protein [Gordonia crocea]|uniref:DUF4189 domain-containing protein n=1 Tax=Gordonia crocea TaxID=589162 RepID=A0A7I9UZS9_9ACTN|nr:DUF4189 domain-containing protein [Gordonia crocea]GED98442.1 hypothetical protein nbrc107697_24810 [Gordonia crocea]